MAVDNIYSVFGHTFIADHYNFLFCWLE